MIKHATLSRTHYVVHSTDGVSAELHHIQPTDGLAGWTVTTHQGTVLCRASSFVHALAAATRWCRG